MDENKLDALWRRPEGPAWVTDLVNGGGGRGGSSSAAAVAGYPHITVPAGFVFGLPVGISFFGRAWSEPTLLKLAYAFEQATQGAEAAAVPADGGFAGVVVENAPSEDLAQPEAAYRATSYFVDGPDGRFAVRIGRPSSEADALAEAHGAAAWTYITAYNPGSVEAPQERNEAPTAAAGAADYGGGIYLLSRRGRGRRPRLAAGAEPVRARYGRGDGDAPGRSSARPRSSSPSGAGRAAAVDRR